MLNPGAPSRSAAHLDRKRLSPRATLGSAVAAIALLGAVSALHAADAPVAKPPEPAKPAEACKATISFPALSGPIKQNANPWCFTIPSFGDIYVGGAFTGYAYTQTNPFPVGTPYTAGTPNPFIPNDRGDRFDLSNVQAFIQKADGPFQFYIQAGAYAIPALGAVTFSTADQTDLLFGPVPVAFAKVVLNDNWSIQGGRMPTLIGAEAPFTFQNLNIARGLLFNQENIINNGVQVNYSQGPFSASVAATDGFLSGKLNWITGNASFKIDDNNTITFDAGANLDRTVKNNYATPLLQNNSTIFNVIYTYSKGPWTITPYFQYTNVDPDIRLGIAQGASTIGGALLASYAFNDNFALAARVEYETQTGNRLLGTGASLLYGPGSSAASFTITPTYTWERYFIRGEYSRVKLFDITRGDFLGGTVGSGFGRTGNRVTQDRYMIETGVVF